MMNSTEAVSVVVADPLATNPQHQQRETIESVIRGQRRMKGTIVSVEQGKCRVIGELGEFPFSLQSVKENKRFPGRMPKPGDRCDFKLSDTNPVKATSIRVIVPKTELATCSSAGPMESAEAAGDADDASVPVSSATYSSTHRSSTSGPISAATGSSAIAASGGMTHSVSASCLTTSPNSLEGGSGIEDLCCGLQRMGTESCSLFSSWLGGLAKTNKQNKLTNKQTNWQTRQNKTKQNKQKQQKRKRALQCTLFNQHTPIM